MGSLFPLMILNAKKPYMSCDHQENEKYFLSYIFWEFSPLDAHIFRVDGCSKIILKNVSGNIKY
jgi:hypothetical protein